MAPTQPPEDLQRALQAISREADLLKARAPAELSGAEALVEVQAHGDLVARFLADVREALSQVFVAGVAYPDPELPDELQNLGERARALGLPTAVLHLRSLRAWLQAVHAEHAPEPRRALGSGAWQEAQRLLAWTRLFTIEHDFLRVQARLPGGGASVARDGAAVPTRSLTVWPAGLDLDASGKVLLFARELETGRAVVLRDQWTDWNRRDPLHGRVVSRLFQDAVDMGRVLSGVVRLEEHPVVERRDEWLFRPAFRAVPRPLAVASSFEPPALPEASPGADGGPTAEEPPGPLALTARLRFVGGQVVALGASNGPLELELSPTLRLTWTKLLARSPARTLDLPLVVVPLRDRYQVLQQRTDLDERVHPSLDPTLFRLEATRLGALAEVSALRFPEAPCAGALLKLALVPHRAWEPDALARLLDGLPGLVPTDLGECWRYGLARLLTGARVEPEKVLDRAREALALGARKDDAAADLLALARVLGRPEGSLSTADLRLLDGRHLHQAVWLVFASGAQDTLRKELMELSRQVYARPAWSPTAGHVCARALLLAFEAGWDGADGSLEEKHPVAKAREFLAGHLADKVPGRSKRSAVTAEVGELFLLADTWAWLTGEDRRGPTLARCGASWERVALPCAEWLCRWTLDGVRDRAGLEAVTDALLTAAVGGVAELLVQ
ncbi:MAG: hypothetical protein HY909_26305 [Deltaproteobacteria bacterium]|nr:hypothetical protein [Deltaproteobacteria bacterium]